jgi:Fe-S cluster biogenesis protein NfuA
MNTLPLPDDSNATTSIFNEVFQVIETEIRPFVEKDGGQIVLKSVENGIVYIELSGACKGCNATDITLRVGVERILRRKIPTITSAKLWK